ncbi:MAG: Type 1 glutamine amidotransferase-like domain-containing protein [Patescibacteria group bacterium]
MIKFILAGGYTTKAPDGGKAFFEELVRGFDSTKPVKILYCIFADPTQAKVKLIEDKEKASKFTPDALLELATEENFLAQLKNSQVLLLKGGETDILMDTLKRCGNWMDLLDGKTVAGTSAGAMALAKYSHALEKDSILEGFGLVPVKVIAHWESQIYDVDWGKALMMLTSYKEDLPLLRLKEGEYVVINK